MAKIYKLPKPNMKLLVNTLYCADNLEVMKQLPAESIDLIYIDPPFATQSVRKEKAWDKEVQLGSFDDRWGGGIQSYILWMKLRLTEMHRLLKPSGCLFIHLDYRATHYVKVELDRIFGYGNLDRGAKLLLNEIIWQRTPFSGSSKSRAKKLGAVHDTILYYAKSKSHQDKFIAPKTDYSEKYLKRFKHKDAHGYYRKTLLKTYSEQTLQRLKKEDRLIYPVKEGANYSYKQYLKESSGKTHIGDLWTDINMLNPQSSERVGYPTQKPRALLERILAMATKDGDVCADFFCGCGTTISAAQEMKRHWIGVDVSKFATVVIRKRMRRDHDLDIEASTLEPLTKSQVLSMHPLEFEKYAVRAIGGIPNEGGPDGGVDGRLPDGTPIQVKKSENIGSPVVASFYQHLEKNGKGIIIAKSFNSGAKEKVAELLNEKGWELTLVTIDDLLREAA